MKNSLIVGLVLVYCTFCAMVAPAAVLIEPVQGSTRLYSGSPGYADTVVFTITVDLKAINNGIRVTKLSGLTMDYIGMSYSNIMQLSSVISSNANLIADYEFDVPNGQTRRFSLVTTVQTLSPGLLSSYLMGLVWRDTPSGITDVNTIYFGKKVFATPEAEIRNPFITPEPTSTTLLAIGAIGLVFRRKRITSSC